MDHKIKHGSFVILLKTGGLQRGVVLYSSQYYHFT